MISIIYKLLRLLRIPARLAKGSALNLIAVLFSQGSTLMINIIVARLLMKEAFGEYAMILTTLLTFAAFSQFAIGSTAAKYIAEYRTVDPQKSGRILGLCVLIVVALALIGSLLLLTLTPWVSKSVLNAPHLAKSLCIGIVFLFFTTVNGFQTGVLSGLEAFGGMAKAGIISGLVAVIAIPVGAWQGGINGAVAGLSASSIVRAGVHYWWVKVETRKQEIFAQYKNCFKQEKEILYKFAIPASMSGLYATPMVWISNSLLVRQPGGYGEMALFAAANNFRMLVMFIPKVINNVGLSMLNNLKGTGNKSSFFKLFKTNTLIIFLVSLAAFISLACWDVPSLGYSEKSLKRVKDCWWCCLLRELWRQLIWLYGSISNPLPKYGTHSLW